MEDWEDDIPPLVSKEQPKSKWDDEDVDDADIKESWEDEDEERLLQPVAKATEEKAPKKPLSKATEKKGKTIEIAKEEPLDPIAEKLRQQRLVEEADFRSTTELFAKKGDIKTVDNFIPKSESDFEEYAELISHKLRPYDKSYHYIALLKAVMRLSTTSLKAADAKDIASSITAITNEKLKAEKEATSKKKTGGKKKQLHVDKLDDNLVVNAYVDVDDYDFM
ncbi:Eukaryotic translation initiation factor 3 subunit J [Gossypium arboreum]|uniref:Eukaryotic translation initiation factor 3 subunit J n=5 Tax=Gossypium TaxID=3633 RepID=A0A1U8MSQ8_GOSHI|nr:eukaryotic translation initiation factor 3 subunit J [Gossypium hirsutum]XP_016729867.1 eukaryotic translation initiation factor 3 subunit J [Gossypium hirsutum]XP_017621492.1 uncharacterized protein LOC108465631 [Gossypium arboreum]XP_017621493.1 uncharacterized protein LOC108465631 [Gossypium arboreum]KAB2067772.1 hypothetical protein ES319_A09G250900v1 [Gossypium barbadense]TYH04152.1 hypothetical protein ES288_A09G276500v1 [Gossypium darwinii]TYI12385.1 hypothetical protein ES332_A09G2